MKIVKMLPLLLVMLLAAGSFMSVASADANVLVTSSGAVKQVSAEDASKLMKDEYLYKETDDMFALKFVFVGIAVALLFTAVSMATGAGNNKG